MRILTFPFVSSADRLSFTADEGEVLRGAYCSGNFILSSDPTLTWTGFVSPSRSEVEEQFKIGIGQQLFTWDSTGAAGTALYSWMWFPLELELPAGKLYLVTDSALIPSICQLVISLSG